MAHSPPPTVTDAKPVHRIFVHRPGLAGGRLLRRTRAEVLNKQTKTTTVTLNSYSPLSDTVFNTVPFYIIYLTDTSCRTKITLHNRLLI